MKLRGCRKISSLKINGAFQDIAYFDCSVPPIFMLELECVQNQLNKDMVFGMFKCNQTYIKIF